MGSGHDKYSISIIKTAKIVLKNQFSLLFTLVREYENVEGYKRTKSQL